MKNKFTVVSIIALALITPFMVNFMTKSQTTTVNYASEGTEPKISLNSTDEPLALGSEVTFTTTIPKDTKNPRVEVLCYQDNKFTFGMAGSVEYEFKLGGEDSKWLKENPDVQADCVANLYFFEKDSGKEVYNILATTSFSVPGK